MSEAQSIFNVELFDPEDSFCKLLSKNNIAFNRHEKNPADTIARDSSIDILRLSEKDTLVQQLAPVLKTWLEEKTGVVGNVQRRIQAQMNDSHIVYLEGLNIEALQTILLDTLTLRVFDPEYNNAFLRQ